MFEQDLIYELIENTHQNPLLLLPLKFKIKLICSNLSGVIVSAFLTQCIATLVKPLKERLKTIKYKSWFLRKQ